MIDRKVQAVAAAFALAMPQAGMAEAQEPAPPQPAPPQQAGPLAPYRAPVIALVQPAAGASLPQDKPVVVFRFAQGEAGDPIDARSFAVTVDGEDQTTLFQVSLSEAWGPLAAEPEMLELGGHEVTARICSARGACSLTTGLVTIAPAGPGGDQSSSSNKRKKTQLLEALLSAVRTLIKN